MFWLKSTSSIFFLLLSYSKLLVYLCREWSGKFPNSKTLEQLAATVGAAVEAANMEVNYPSVILFDRSNPKRRRCLSRETAPLENEETLQKDVVKAKNSSSKVPGFKILDMKVCLINICFPF